jgi:hypothetical protein
MTKTITLNELNVKQITIDYQRQAVIVLYDMVDAAGRPWISSEATFFVTMPPQQPILDENGQVIGYEPYPDAWFLLPPSYIPQFVSLLNDADAALTARFLV